MTAVIVNLIGKSVIAGVLAHCEALSCIVLDGC